MDNAKDPREARLRGKANTKGFAISRRDGGYILAKREHGTKIAILGYDPPYSATLDEIEIFLEHQPYPIRRGIRIFSERGGGAL